MYWEIRSCLLPLRCLVKAGTGLLNATYATGDIILLLSAENVLTLPLHTPDVLADMFNAIQARADLAASFVQVGEKHQNSVSEVVF